jgi:3-phytase
VFDGPEDRNGLRNRDEIGLLASIIDPARNSAINDDRGQNGGLNGGDLFVIAGDMNADPFDGDSASHAIDQLLSHSLINAEVIPTSTGAQHAATSQGGNNQQHQGNPAADTADFDDTRGPGNLRIDYVLPSRTLQVLDSGVYWPAPGQTGADWIEVSDHRLVWLDIQWPASKAEQPPQ